MNMAKQIILDLAKQKGILRARDLGEGLSRVTLRRLVQGGVLIALSRGLYIRADENTSENSARAEVAIRYPKAVFCLLTALQMHELTTQIPHQVWLAVDVKARAPNMKYPPLKVVRFSGEALHEGVENRFLDGVINIRVTCIEKTIADCFKYRNKIGVDIAIEALKDAWGKNKISIDLIWKYAKICRVSRIMRPYLESLIG